MQTRILLPLIAISLLLGCQKEDQLIEISLVDPALQPYFRTFEAEASARGITLDPSFFEIEATIREINDGDVIGQCWYDSHYPNEIQIDRAYWQSASYSAGKWSSSTNSAIVTSTAGTPRRVRPMGSA